MSDQNLTPQQQEQKNLKIEILEQVSGLAAAGFGLVAALAWNDAIKALFEQFFPSPAGNTIAKFGYAIIITVIVVLITVQLGRVVNLAKKQLKQDKK